MTKGLSAVLVAFIVVITFPVWIGLIVGGFGLVAGLLAAVVGVFVGLFAGAVGLIVWILKGIFGGIFDWGWNDPMISFPHVHFNGYVVAAIVILIALAVTRRKQ